MEISQVNISILNQNFREINPLICGWEICLSGHDYGPAARDYYLMHYIVSGRGRYQCNGKTYAIEANQAFLIFPNDVTYYVADEVEPWTYIWIGFSGASCPELISQSGLSRDHCVLTDLRIGRIFMEVRAEAENLQLVELFLTSKLFELFSILGRPLLGKTPQQEYINRTIDYILFNYDRQISIEGIARTIGIERHYLSRLFQAKTGQTPRDFLNQVRMSRAAQYLTQSEYSVQDAARSVGFQDVFTFSKAFKRFYGYAPSDYRKSHSGNRMKNKTENGWVNNEAEN